MTNGILLVVCLLAGMIMRVTKAVPDNTHAALNGFIVQVALPCLILGQLHQAQLTTEMLWPIMMPWILLGLSIILFACLQRAARIPANTTGALIMSAGLANTSFVGLPMIETFYGVRGLPTGIIIDQLGSYLALGTLGTAVACYYSNDGASMGAIARRIVSFPPLIALVIALATSGLHYPSWLEGVLTRLGGTLAPLALVSVGLQLRLDRFAGRGLFLAAGLVFKLLLGPLVLLILYVFVLGRDGETTRITLFESAMGPMIGGAIVATRHGLDPPLVTLMVGVGIVFSFVTLPLWWLVLARI
jgi:predicted permease